MMCTHLHIQARDMSAVMHVRVRGPIHTPARTCIQEQMRECIASVLFDFDLVIVILILGQSFSLRNGTALTSCLLNPLCFHLSSILIGGKLVLQLDCTANPLTASLST